MGFQSRSRERHLNTLKILIRRFSLANLFIQKLKFLTVRQKFKDCLEPFDVADIMEQYKSGPGVRRTSRVARDGILSCPTVGPLIRSFGNVSTSQGYTTSVS